MNIAQNFSFNYYNDLGEYYHPHFAVERVYIPRLQLHS